MPACNLTLTLTGIGEPYEVRYYINAPRALTSTDVWKVGNTFTLIGNSAAETATKSYTGTQISSICKNNTPYIYKTYRYGTYYNAALSSSITINGYRKVISGTHTKAGWWTAASGGTYVNVDGAASGDNQGKICASDWRGYAKSGTLSNGKKERSFPCMHTGNWIRQNIPSATGNRKQTVLHQPMTIKIMNLPKQRRKKHRSEVE